MIYKIMFEIVILNILYELIEMVMPDKKIKGTVKFAVMIVMLYVFVDLIFELF